MTQVITNVIDGGKELNMDVHASNPRQTELLKQMLENLYRAAPHVTSVSVNGTVQTAPSTPDITDLRTAFDAKEPLQAAATSVSKNPKVELWLHEEMSKLADIGVTQPDIGMHTAALNRASNSIVPTGRGATTGRTM